MNINEVNAIGMKFSKDGEETVYVNLHQTHTAYGTTYHRFVKAVAFPTCFDMWSISQGYFDEQVKAGNMRVIQTFGEMAG